MSLNTLNVQMAGPDYVERKLAELHCLASLLPRQKIRRFGRRISFQEFFEEKLRLKRELRVEMARSSNLKISASNLTGLGQVVKERGLEFRYNYQRCGVEPVGMEHLRRLHPGLARKNPMIHFSAYTTSCQAALSTFFSALSKMKKAPPVRFYAESAYWETMQFMGISLGAKSLARNAKGRTILFIDSSTIKKGHSHEDLRRAIKASTLVIVDTTCFDSRDEKLGEIYSACQTHWRPLFLFRSHVKLDCLATEFGRLGSVFLLLPRAYPVDSDIFLSGLLSAFRDHGRLFGMYASIDQIYPFFGNRKFSKMNGARNLHQRAANAAVIREVRNRPEIECFDHDLFFLVSFEGELEDEDIRRKVESLSLGLCARNVPLMISPSYPWDFLSITAFARDIGFGTKPRQTKIRISVGDFDPKLSQSVAEGISYWLKSLK